MEDQLNDRDSITSDVFEDVMRLGSIKADVLRELAESHNLAESEESVSGGETHTHFSQTTGQRREINT